MMFKRKGEKKEGKPARKKRLRFTTQWKNPMKSSCLSGCLVGEGREKEEKK